MATTKFRNNVHITGDLLVDGTINGEGIASGTQVAAIPAPTGGATTDTEARAAINSIIAALVAFDIAAS